MLLAEELAGSPVAEPNSGRNQAVAHPGKGKHSQGCDRRKFEQLAATLPFKFLIFEPSDHVDSY